MNSQRLHRTIALGAVALLLAVPLSLAQQGPATEITWATAEDPGVILVQNADRIWTQGPDGILENADMLVRDGTIVEIGGGISPPEGAMVIDATGMQVTPGLIDAHSHTGADAINEGTNSVTAEVRIPDVLDATDLTWYRQLAGGLTTAQVLHGSANSIGGQAATVKLRYKADRATDMLLEGATPTIKFALGENVKRNPDRYPNTRMGVEQTIRGAFRAAQDYQRRWEEWNTLTEEQQSHRVPPRRDLQLEALVEILEGDREVHSHSYRQDEILMLIRLAEDFGFQIGAFQHVLEGYKVAHEIAAHGAGASTFSDWWAYKIEAYDAIPYNGAIMHRDGVVVSFNSDNGDLARRMNLEAAKAVRYGDVPEEEALDFVTINPAIQLGIDDQVGSLEVGKDADFVVWNGHPMSVYSRPEMTFVDGRKMFDRELDLQFRQNVAAEKERLLAEVREAGDGDERGGRGARGGDEAEAEEEPGAEADEEPGDAGAEALEGFTNPAPPGLEYNPSQLPDAGTFAIVGATVHTVSGPSIDDGVVVFADGRITAVGDSSTEVPSDATRIDAAGQHVYPGLISANTILGLTEIGSVDEGNDVGEMGDINPNIRAEVAVNPGSELIPVARGNGITHAVTAPRGGLIAGTSALMRLDGWTWEGMAAVAPVSMHVRFPRFRRGGRGFRGGGGGDNQQEEIDLINETLDDARAYARAQAAAAAGGPAHETDLRLEALVPVVEGRMPLAVHTSDARAVEEAVEWAAGQGLRIVLYDSGDAWRVADLLAEHDVPVIVDEVLSMPSRSDEPYDLSYAKPALLHEAGVRFAIATGGSGGDGSDVRNLPFHAGVAGAFGLPKEEALKAVTLYPAEILGFDEYLGSIEVGKSASLVITDGDILEIRSHVLQEFIDGRPVDLTSKHTELYERYDNRPRPVRGGGQEP